MLNLIQFLCNYSHLSGWEFKGQSPPTQEKEIEVLLMDKELAYVSVCIDDVSLHVRDPKHSTQMVKILKLRNTFHNVAGYKINKQKSADFL